MFNTDSKDITYNPGKQGQFKKDLAPIKIADDAILNAKIFPDKVISGYHAAADETTALAWEHYMLSLAQEIPEAASVYWCSGEWLPDISPCHRRSHQATYLFLAFNSGSTGGRAWFGYLFSVPLDSSDFEDAPKDLGVTGAQAWS
jgi:hypothetical protein